MFLELLHHNGHGAFQLRIMSGRHVLRQFFHRHIGRNAMAFNFPLAAETIDRITRCGHEAPIDQSRIPSDSHQAAPGARAHQSPQACLAEVPGHGVAT